MRFDGPQLCSFSSNAHDNLSYRQCRVPEEVVRRLVDRMGHQEHVDRGGRLGGQRRFLPLPGPLPFPSLPLPSSTPRLFPHTPIPWFANPETSGRARGGVCGSRVGTWSPVF